MPKPPERRRPANFKPFGVYWADAPVRHWPGHGRASEAIHLGQKVKLFKTSEEARVWVVTLALRRRFVGVIYERTGSGRLSHGKILERFNGGHGWWERPNAT